MTKVIELYTPQGELTVYRKLSARLPEFLREYGPAQGYALETEIQDSLSLKPGLLKLYEVALQAGHKPEDLGLPSLVAAGLTQVCRATLRDATGRVVATATAAKLIQAYKDLEVLETAARQRLLAALGFGGEVFDEDEAHDQGDQGLRRVPPRPDPAAETIVETVVAGVPSPASASHPVAETPTEVTRASVAPAAPGLLATDALALLQRQIAHLAKVRGVDPPVVGATAEAQVALKHLMATAV